MPGADEFIERTLYLQSQVGHGDITAGCTVDQPYAQDQHETMHYKHPRGGRARYLGGPLLENNFENMEYIARHVITPTGSDLEDAMIEIAETMAYDYVGEEAPVLTTALRRSGSPWVRNNGVETFYRPPAAARERDGE